jgi:RNA polymerase sigma factor (sigma-70 family)
VRCGDDQAFGELYARYGRRIVSYVFGMVGDHGRSEDIAQEVFISALRRMRGTARPIVFKPWIYEIAKNACIDEFRRARRVREVPLGSDDDEERNDLPVASAGASPHAAFERRQQLDDLRGAFRGLSDTHHKILVLRELEGLSYSEIASRMGMTRPVVESTLFRARRRLGQEYDEIATGRRCEQVRAVIDTGGSKAVRGLGLREHRRLARHVAHCQPCRRYAWAAGIDESLLKPPSLPAKIAALLPIPAFMRWRRDAANKSAAISGSHPIASLQTVQAMAALADPASSVVTLGRAAAAVAAVAIAGGGVAAGLSSHAGSQPAKLRHHANTAAARSGGSVPGAHGLTDTGAWTGVTLQPSSAQSPRGRVTAIKSSPASASGGSTPATQSSSGGGSQSSGTHIAGPVRASHPSISGTPKLTVPTVSPAPTELPSVGELPTVSVPAPSAPTPSAPTLSEPTASGTGSLDPSQLTQPVTLTVSSTLGLVPQTTTIG